jgi:hypothetical protein
MSLLLTQVSLGKPAMVVVPVQGAPTGSFQSPYLSCLSTPPQMSLHTAQQLLSSVIDASLKAPTLTWSLTSWPSPSPAYISGMCMALLDGAFHVVDPSELTNIYSLI